MRPPSAGSSARDPPTDMRMAWAPKDGMAEAPGSRGVSRPERAGSAENQVLKDSKDNACAVVTNYFGEEPEILIVI